MGTTFGKLLVMLNLVLSLVLAGLGFALFSTGIDWSDNKGKAGKPDGETLILKQQLVKDLGALGFKPVLSGDAETPPQGAAASWTSAKKALGEAENRRAGARPFYSTSLKHLLTGATADRPAQEVELENHVPVLVPGTNLPKMKDAEHNKAGLVARSVYLNDIRSQRDQGLDFTRRLAKEYGNDITETDKLIGNIDYDPAKPKEADRKGTDRGLVSLIARDRDKREGLEEEMRLVESQDVNTQIDALAVNRSNVSVEDRIKELEGYLKKRGVAFTPWEAKAGKKEVEKKD